MLGNSTDDLMCTQSTKASTIVSSSNTGTLLNQSNKTSFNGSSVASPKLNPNKQGNVNLDVIEEELQIEEGNENEFES